MAEQHCTSEAHRVRASTYGLDLTKRKDRQFYTQLTGCPKMLALWLDQLEHQRLSTGQTALRHDQ